MTAATAAAPPPTTRPTDAAASTADLEPTERLKRSAQTLVVAVIDLAAGKAVDLVEGVSDRLEDVSATAASGAGVGMSAALGAGSAWLAGGNPVWGAVKGGWQALSTGAKVGIVLLLILLAVLSPVALLVALVVLLVVAIVRAASS